LNKNIIKKPYIIAGIPAYNEEKTIAKVIRYTKKYVDKIIVIDDGSQDMTGEIAEALGAYVIKNKKNLGKGEAIKKIFRIAREMKADVLVLLDADLQHDPNYIPRFLEPILRGEADIVVGSRFLSSDLSAPRYRKIGLKILSKLANIMANIRVSDPLSGFRTLSRKSYESIRLTESNYGIEVEMLAIAREMNLRIKEIPIHVNYNTGTRTSKKSSINQAIDIARAIFKITIERKPLLYLGGFSLVLFLIGFYLSIEMIDLFIKFRYLSIPLGLIAIVFLQSAIVLILTAIKMYMIRNKKKSS